MFKGGIVDKTLMLMLLGGQVTRFVIMWIWGAKAPADVIGSLFYFWLSFHHIFYRGLQDVSKK